MLGNIAVGVIVVVVLALLFPPVRRLVASFLGYTGAQLDNAAESLASKDAIGQYKSKIKDAIEKGQNAQKVVDTAAKQLVSLENQIADDLKDQQKLTNRLTAVTANGDPNKTAEKYALELERVERNLAANQAQKAAAQQSYDENLALVERYENEVQNARKDAEQLGFQLEQSEAEKNLYQMTAALKDKLNLGELAQARQRVQDQINANRGSAKASRDLSRQGLAEEADEDLEQKERAKAILARFQKPEASNSAPVPSNN